MYRQNNKYQITKTFSKNLNFITEEIWQNIKVENYFN